MGVRMTTIQEPELCIWKKVAITDLEKIANETQPCTTFTDTNHKCHQCEGYKTNCMAYLRGYDTEK